MKRVVPRGSTQSPAEAGVLCANVYGAADDGHCQGLLCGALESRFPCARARAAAWGSVCGHAHVGERSRGKRGRPRKKGRHAEMNSCRQIWSNMILALVLLLICF